MALTQVSTKGIKNGTILDEDISNSAAIAASKVSGLSTDSITEGNSKVEVVDTGSNGYVSTVVDGTETIRTITGQTTINYARIGANWDKTSTSGTGIAIGDAGNSHDMIASSATNGIDIQSNTSVSIGQNGFPNQDYANFSSSNVNFFISGNAKLQLSSSGLTTHYSILPNADSTLDIGTNTNRFANIYADTLYGDGSNLTGISAGTSLSGSTNNTICTVTGANAIQGEANLTFDGNQLKISHGSPEINLYDTTNNTNCYVFSDDNGSLRIQADQNSSASDTRVRIQTDGIERVSIDEHTKILDGNLIIGTAGHGIDFSATSDVNQSSELLDDYEEGTFTPTARGHNTNSSPVISGSGKYTKIGRLVQITLSFSNENGSYLPSGEYFQIHGLPFIADGTHIMGTYGMNYRVVFNSDNHYYFYMPNNGTILWGYRNISDQSYQPWSTNDWDSTQWYHSNTFTYMTDT